MNEPTPAPSRSGLNENNFRRYEPIIRDACLNWPSSTRITPPPEASILTTVARLRDAIRSLKLYNWDIDWDKTNLSKLIVIHNNDGVFIGKSKAEVVKDIGSAPISQGPVKILHLGKTELEAFCLLITNKHLEGPILFSLNHDASGYIDLDYLIASYDIAIVPHTDTSFLLT